MFVVFIHSIASIVALVLGSISLMKTKGTRFHKILGWMFISFMLLSTISSFWIGNHFSIIHILSILVIIWLLRAIHAIRFKPKNWLYIHASTIGATYIAILIAGAGVIVRKIILPNNYNAGYIVSGISAIFLIYFLNLMTRKYKHKP